jgi:hypothetical protein
VKGQYHIEGGDKQGSRWQVDDEQGAIGSMGT